MGLEEFLSEIDGKAPPAAEHEIVRFEEIVGERLPQDYRAFLAACNGGSVGGALWFVGRSPDGEAIEAGVHHIGGFRNEDYFSLEAARKVYEGRLPRNLVWIMDDPFGNAICVGVAGEHRGRIYFWDHELEPDNQRWDGSVEGAGNVTLLASSFAKFVAGLRPNVEQDEVD